MYLDSFALSSSAGAAALKIPGGTEVLGIRARTEGAAFSHTEVQAETIAHFQTPSPSELAGQHHI